MAALEAGVKGGKWYSQIDKLYPEDTLGRAFAQVAANRGAAGLITSSSRITRAIRTPICGG